MTTAISSSSIGTQSVTQISLSLETQASPLAFTATGATYRGQPIALSDIVSDRSGRFTDAQKKQAAQVQQQFEAQTTIAELSPILPANAGNAAAASANGSFSISLSATSLQLLNEMPSVAGTTAVNLSVSQTTAETATTESTAQSQDGSSVSASVATAQYTSTQNLSVSTAQS